MLEILKFTFSGPFVWLGVFILFSALLQFFFKCYNRTLRHFNLRSHGWPPNHLDLDGDFRSPPVTDKTTDL